MKLQPKDFSRPERFLWPDLPGATDTVARLAHLRTAPSILATWIADGTVLLPQAARPTPIAEFLAAAQRAIAAPDSPIRMTYWDDDGHHYEPVSPDHLGKTEAKVLDLHIHVEATHAVVFAPAILDFVTDIFQDDAVAFQCLYFENGSQQGCHQDTAFVYVDPPYQFAASWIALEDVVPGSGELFYYRGSHRLDDVLFQDGTKALRGGDPDGPGYSAALDELARESGLTRDLLHVAKGDALMWAADLMHGGMPIQTRHTRRSLVTHYCPKSALVPYVAASGKQPVQVRDRGWVVGQN